MITQRLILKALQDTKHGYVRYNESQLAGKYYVAVKLGTMETH